MADDELETVDPSVLENAYELFERDRALDARGSTLFSNPKVAAGGYYSILDRFAAASPALAIALSGRAMFIGTILVDKRVMKDPRLKKIDPSRLKQAIIRAAAIVPISRDVEYYDFDTFIQLLNQELG